MAVNHISITLKKIAEIAGVSRGTVDRVIHNRGNVKPEISQRIKQIAEERGYKPNIIGKALAYQRNPIQIGIVINGVGNVFFDDVLEGVEAAKNEFSDFGINITVKSSKGYNVEKQLKLIEELEENNIVGLAIAPINNELIATKLNQLYQKGVKIVVFNSDIYGASRLAFVGCNYEQSGRCAGSLLGKFLSGTGNVFVVYGTNKMLGHIQRLEGFKKIISEDYHNKISVTEYIENFDDNEISYKELTKSLQKSVPDGILFIAGGVEGGIQAIKDSDLHYKIKVITCDETPFIKYNLIEKVIDATICQQPFEQGYRPIKIIFDSIVSHIEPLSSIYYTKNEIRILENL